MANPYAERYRRDNMPKGTWLPRIKVPAERLVLLNRQLPVIARYRNANEKSPLPQELKDELRDSRKWILAGIRQAQGKMVATGNVPGRLPPERVVIKNAYESAMGVDELIARCENALGRVEGE